MYITPAATSLPPPASIFQEAERLRFDSLELDHLEKLEAERLGRNLSRMRFAEQLLGEHGHGTLADALLTMRNKCTDLGSDPGSDSGIRALLWSLKTDPQHASYAAKIGTVYSSISDMVCQQAWSRFLKCWEVWSNVASLHDHRLVSIGISRRPDIAMVPYKRALDELRDRVVARVRPYANWYSWQLDISVAKNNRHPHYHLLCIIPSDLAEAFYDDIGDLRFGVFRGGEGLMDVGHCDWQEGDRRRKPLDLADRQEAWIMALAYVTRVFTERDMPRWTCAPTLSCPLEVEDYRDQIGRAWDQALLCTAVRKPSSGAPAFVPARAA